jgi:DNA (cytosine-5)-methyltransferase 1
MFQLPLLRRERWFETSWKADYELPPHNHSGPALTVTGSGVGAGHGQRERVARVLGHNPRVADVKKAMGINWMSVLEMAQAIPPAYTELVARLLMDELLNA